MDVLKAILLCLSETVVQGIAVVKSVVNKRCADGASRIKVYVIKIADVVETCTRDRRDVIREQMMRIENETKVASRGSKMD